MLELFFVHFDRHVRREMGSISSAIATWFLVRSCAEASDLGWVIGVASGGLVDLVAVLAVLQARRLNAGMPDTMAESAGLRVSRRVVFSLVPLLWFAGIYWTWGPWTACSVVSLAGGSAVLVGVVCLVAMLTAANQIGVRSIR